MHLFVGSSSTSRSPDEKESQPELLQLVSRFSHFFSSSGTAGIWTRLLRIGLSACLRGDAATGAETRTSPVSFSLSSNFTRNWLPVLKTTRSPIKVLFGHIGSVADPRCLIRIPDTDPPPWSKRSQIFYIPDPGVKKAPDFGTRIRIRNRRHRCRSKW